jgi:ribulose-phosphate 3-epimerase
MIEIIPAILPQTYKAIERDVELVHEIAPTIQIDFCDGKYVPTKTWWYNTKDEDRKEAILNETEGLPFWDSTNYEFDLMIADPLSQVDEIMRLGPSKVIFHLKTVSVEALVAYFESLPEIVRQTVSFGIALRHDDDPVSIAPLIPHLRRIQCMGIDTIGIQGQPFNTATVAMVKTLHDLYGGSVRIGVDGGVNASNIPGLVAAGARRLVVGSAVFQSVDPHATIQMLQDIANA